MQIIKAKLMSLSVYKNILELEPVRAILRLCDSKTPEDLIRAYTDMVYGVWQEGHNDLSDYLSWHLKYDDSFVGEKMANGTITEPMQDAATMDIRWLSGIAMLSCAGMKSKLYQACVQRNSDYGPIIQNLAELPVGKGFTEDEIFESYRINGCGRFALTRTFHWEKGQLIEVRNPDRISPEAMIGYDYQRQQVLENTRVLVNGKRTNNVLLYGDSGTGKSATVKSMLQVPEFHNLRLIEVAKNSLDELTQLVRLVGKHTQKFILYIDDLSFENEDKGFSALKSALEGSLEDRPENVAIYVTSNRRHMIRESFADRQGDDVHAKETLEERSSLSARFGLRLAYLALDKQRYTDMVLTMCHQAGVQMTDDAIRVEANRWEIRHGGRTPRTAVQLVEALTGQTT